jgi:hypothetical protein
MCGRKILKGFDHSFSNERQIMDKHCSSNDLVPTNLNLVNRLDPTTRQRIECTTSKFGDFTSKKDEGKAIKMKDYWRQKSMMSPKYAQFTQCNIDRITNTANKKQISKKILAYTSDLPSFRLPTTSLPSINLNTIGN